MGTKRILLCLAVLAAGFGLSVGTAHANSPITVTKTSDSADGTCDADCSLREAIIKANTDAGDDVINLSSGTYTLSIAKTSDTASDGDLDVTDNLTINGPATIQQTITHATTGFDRVLEASSPATLTLNEITVTGGSTTDSGGGIKVDGGATLDLNSSTVANNANYTGATSAAGGGVASAGTLNMSSSTISGNNSYKTGTTYVGNGGGVAVIGGSATITNSTFNGNTAQANGGAIYIPLGGTVDLSFSTVAGNIAAYLSGGGIANYGSGTAKASIFSGNTGDNCVPSVTSQDYNVDADGSCGFSEAGDTMADPHLGSLADNGGPVKTMSITGLSPNASSALDRVPSTDATCTGTGTDARGVTRPTGAGCDSGAFEVSDYPDASIALPSQPGVGLTIFNHDGTNQTVAKRLKRGKTASFTVDVNNAGDASDQYYFLGCASSRGFTVHYYNGSAIPANDITTQVVAGTWESPLPVNPGGGYGILMTIKVGHSGPKHKLCDVTETSNNAGTSDTVAANVTAK
jgi:CSLREA domain-containing protein